jgi:hypothetical protein
MTSSARHPHPIHNPVLLFFSTGSAGGGVAA